MTPSTLALRTSLVLFGGLVVAYAPPAAACDRVPDPGGYAVALRTSTVIMDDEASPLACDLGGPSCGSPIRRYHAIERQLQVDLVTSETTSEGRDDTFVGSDVTYVLKDEAGAEVARTQGTPRFARFDRTATTVCVKTHRAKTEADGGAAQPDLDAPEAELCAPIGELDFTVTDAEREQHRSDLSVLCGADYEPQGDDPAAGGGCSMGSGAVTGSGSLALLFGTMLVLRRRAKRE